MRIVAPRPDSSADQRDLELQFGFAKIAPVTQVVAVHFVMVAHPSLPAKNVKQLIALAKARPGEITFLSSGAGGAPHLGGELFKRMANVDMVHVPYKGSGPSFADLLGGARIPHP